MGRTKAQVLFTTDKNEISPIISALYSQKRLKTYIFNYRPISLLFHMDKIYERIVYNYLYKFIEKHNLICNLQFGFRQKHSTSYALIHLAEKIR